MTTQTRPSYDRPLFDLHTAKRRLVCQTTIKDGRIWYERPAGE